MDAGQTGPDALAQPRGCEHATVAMRQPPERLAAVLETLISIAKSHGKARIFDIDLLELQPIKIAQIGDTKIPDKKSAKSNELRYAASMSTWGGRRPGAGRPPKGPRSSEPHKQRQAFRAQEPVRVTLRLEPDVRRLPARDLARVLREATLCVARRDDVRIVHLRAADGALQLVVEAQHRTALARGMQAFQISAARHINAALSRHRGVRRRGRVFCDRYRVEILSRPRLVRQALAQLKAVAAVAPLVLWEPRGKLLRRIWRSG